MNTRLSLLLAVLGIVLIGAGYWYWSENQPTTETEIKESKEEALPPTEVSVQKKEEIPVAQGAENMRTYTNEEHGLSFSINANVEVVFEKPIPKHYPTFTQIVFKQAGKTIGFVYINPAPTGFEGEEEVGEKMVTVGGVEAKILIMMPDVLDTPERNAMVIMTHGADKYYWRWDAYEKEESRVMFEQLLASVRFK